MPGQPHPHAQIMSALQKANAVRIARGKIKKAIASGEITAAEIIANPPECTQAMTIFDLLCAQHRWAQARVSKHLEKVGIAEGKTLQSLTTRQRAHVVWGLPGADEAAAALDDRDDSERTQRAELCVALNGHGPCLRTQDHDGECVVARHYEAVVEFFGYDSGTLLARRNSGAVFGHRCPPVLELVAMFTEEMACSPC